MKNPDVYLEQFALAELGFYHGKLDGDRGPVTRAARGAWEESLEEPTRHLSADGLRLIKEFEGLYLRAYDDGGGVMTIGWGHTGLRHNDGTVYRGRVITREEAECLLQRDMQVFERAVRKLVTVPLNDDEFAALVSFHFNTGGLGKSTLLKKLNAGDRAGAADEFLRWNKDNGRTLAGLTRRRQSERNLFLGKRPFIVP